MNRRLSEVVVRLSRNLFDLTNGQHWRHYSFLIRKNAIHSIGWNQPWKTHPLCKRFGHKFSCIHSEVHCVTKLDVPVNKLYKYTMVNVRLDKNGLVRMSKPCGHCQDLLLAFNVGEVWYSTNNGDFAQLCSKP